VEGATVTWAVSQGNGILSSTQTITDSKGQAQIILTPSSTGTITVTAQASFTSARSNIFTFTVTGIPTLTLALVSGDKQSGPVGVPLPAPFVVSVTNSAPVEGATVTWAVSQGNGTLSSTQTNTDSKGQAQITLTPNSTGTITVTAQASFTSARSNIFTFTVTGGQPPTLAILSGNNQMGIINAPLPNPLVVSATDATTIHWEVDPANSGTFGARDTTVIRDPSSTAGQSSNTFTLGAFQGAIRIIASANGVSVAFAVNNATPAAVQGLKAFTALENVALTTATVQVRNIGIRLAALRDGATGVSLSGLSLNVDGQSVSAGAISGLLSGFGAGGASADSSPLGRFGVFANGQGTFGNQTGTSREPGSDFHTAGFTLGADYRLTDNLILGSAFGYTTGKTNLADNGGDFSATGYSVSAYGSLYVTDRFYVDVIGIGSWNDYDTARKVVFDSTAATAKASTNSTLFAISVNTGYTFNIGALSLGPTARVDYINVNIDSFREHGAGIFDLTVDSQLIESLVTDIGGLFSYAISTRIGVLTPSLRVAWEHQYKESSRLITGHLVADPVGTRLVAPTDNPTRDYCNLGVSIVGQFKYGISSFISFDTQLGRSDVNVYSLSGGIHVAF